MLCAWRIPLDFGGEELDKVVVSSLLLEQIAAGCDQRLFLIWQPFGCRHEHVVEPSVGCGKVAHASQGSSILLLKAVIMWIVGSELLPQLDGFLALPGSLEDTASRFIPAFHGCNVDRLPLIDWPQCIQQPQLLVGLDNAIGIGEEEIGEAKIVAIR